MKSLIIYHSETGNTRRVAEYIHEKTESDLIDLKPKKAYSKLGMYTSGIKKALMQQADEIELQEIDLQAYDTIIIGTPVWAGRQTPVINAGLAQIKNGTGKKAIIFATYGKSEAETFSTLRKKLEESGMIVAGSYGFSEKETEDFGKIDEMIKAAGL